MLGLAGVEKDLTFRKSLCDFEDGGNESRIPSALNRPSHMFHLFLAVFPEIFLINATFILLIYGVVFSTSQKESETPLVSNLAWLGLLSVARLGGQRAWDAEDQLPNLMRPDRREP